MRQTLTSLCLLLTGFASASTFSANEHLWYTQPADMPNTALPWAPRPHATGNLSGKLNRDTWESQTLPIGNGRIGGTVYSGDQLDCVVLNETSLWSGGANTPENSNTIIMRGTLANGEVFEGRILVRTRGGLPADSPRQTARACKLPRQEGCHDSAHSRRPAPHH